ncbi:hypothetical protein AVEN_73115-1, partial [Araneus ventricosus]
RAISKLLELFVFPLRWGKPKSGGGRKSVTSAPGLQNLGRLTKELKRHYILWTNLPDPWRRKNNGEGTLNWGEGRTLGDGSEMAPCFVLKFSINCFARFVLRDMC